MIDIKHAKEVFANYVKKYDAENGKIAFKIRHIYRVADKSKEIAVKNNLNNDDQDLAELIGLLHDIGRFEQLRKYNTFNDNKSEDHAVIGVRVLFEEGLIKDFVETREYDEIIKTAILNHNNDRIEEGLDERTLLFCRIIRDADKLDIFHVLITEDFEDAYEQRDLSEECISDTIYKEFMKDNYIVYANRETKADCMVGHIAYIFDFNYDDSLKIIKEGKYIERLVERGNYKNPKTIKRFKKIIKYANKFMNKKLKK